MFAVKKATKAPICWAKGCTAMCADRLCDKHEGEWLAAGKPELVYAPAAPKPPKATSTTIVLAPEQSAEFTAERHKLQDALRFAQQFALDTPEQRSDAQRIANGFHAKAKELEAKLKHILAPFKEGIDRIRDEVKPNIDIALAIKKTLLERLGEKNAELELERTLALRQIEAGAGVAPPEAFAAAHTSLAAPDEGGGFTDRYLYDVVDARALPRTFWMEVVNHTALDAHVQANGTDNVPPGVSVRVIRVARVGKAA